MGPRSTTPFSPMSTAIHALDSFSNKERDNFYDAIDSLPNFDSPTRTDYYEIEEEDWHWLATAVGTRTQTEVVQYAQLEFDKLAADPELVCFGPAPRACAP